MGLEFRQVFTSGGGGEPGETPTLAQVLGVGNSTSGTDIVISAGDGIRNLVADGVTYPTAPGTDGQIMVIDGSGVLTFQDAPTGGGGDVVERLTEDRDVLLTLASTTAEKQALIDAQPKYIDDGINLYFTFEEGVHDLGTDSLTIRGFHGGGRVGFNNVAKTSNHVLTDIGASAKTTKVTSAGRYCLILRQNTCESRVYHLEVENTSTGSTEEWYYAVFVKDSINFKIFNCIATTPVTAPLAIPVVMSGVGSCIATKSHIVSLAKQAPAIWALDAIVSVDQCSLVGLNAVDNLRAVAGMDSNPDNIYDLDPSGKIVLRPLDTLGLILSGSNDAEGQSIVGLNGLASEAGTALALTSDTAVTIQGIAYPAVDGADGQVLTAKGDGTTEFRDASGGVVPEGIVQYDVKVGDTAADINAVIQAAPAASSILFEQGTYSIDESIVVDRGLHINGNGAFLKSSVDGITLMLVTDVAQTTIISNFIFHSFQAFDAYDNPRIAGDRGVHLLRCANNTVQNCSFVGFLDVALGVEGENAAAADKRQSSNKFINNIIGFSFCGFSNWDNAEYGLCTNNIIKKCRTAIMSCSGNYTVTNNSVVDCRAGYVTHDEVGDHITAAGGNFAHGLCVTNTFNHCSDAGGIVWNRQDIEIGTGVFVDAEGVYMQGIIPPTYASNANWYTPINVVDASAPLKVDMGKITNTTVTQSGTEPILLRDTDLRDPVTLVGDVEHAIMEPEEPDFTITFNNTNARFFGELGLPDDQGWQDSNLIELADDTVFGVDQQVVVLNDNSDQLAETRLPLTTQNWQDIIDYGAVFSGTARLDAVNGNLGFFPALQAGAADHPIDDKERQYGFIFRNEDQLGFLSLIELDSENGDKTTRFDGTLGNPAIPYDEWFTYECIIPPGLGLSQVYINNILTTATPGFRINGGFSGSKVIIASGASGGTERVTYHTDFGATIFEGPATTTLPVEMLATDGSAIIVPEGRRDYTIIFPDGAPQDAGDTITVTHGNINGTVTVRTQDLDNPVCLFNGLNSNTVMIRQKSTSVITNTVDNNNIYTMPVDEVNRYVSVDRYPHPGTNTLRVSSGVGAKGSMTAKISANTDDADDTAIPKLVLEGRGGTVVGEVTLNQGQYLSSDPETLILGSKTHEVGLGANGVTGILLDADCAEQMIRLKDNGLDIEPNVPISIRSRLNGVVVRANGELDLVSDTGRIDMNVGTTLDIDAGADVDIDAIGNVDILAGGNLFLNSNTAIGIGNSNTPIVALGTTPSSTVTIGTEDLGSGEATVQISGNIKIGTASKASFVDIQAVDQVVIQAGNSVVLGTTEEIYIGQADSALILIGDVGWPTGLPSEGQILIGNTNGDLEWGTAPAGAASNIQQVLTAGNDAGGLSIIGLNGITSVNGATLNITSDTSVTLNSADVTLSAGAGGINVLGNFTVGDTASTASISLDAQTSLDLLSEGGMSLQANGGPLTLNGTAWPAGAGGADQVLISDGAGALNWGSNAASLLSLAQALVNGQRTGGNDIFVEEGDKISGEPANQLGVDGTDLVLTGGSSIDAEEGSVIISGLKHPKVDGKAGDVLQTDGAGNLQLGEVVPKNYVNAYDVTTQAIATPGTTQAIQFSDTSFNDGWVHVNGTAPFICPADGLYEISVSGQIERSGGSNTQTFAMLTEVDGTQVIGSYFSLQPRTEDSVYNFSHSFLTNVNEGESLVLFAASDNDDISIVPATAVVPVTVNPSITIVIKRV